MITMPLYRKPTREQLEPKKLQQPIIISNLPPTQLFQEVAKLRNSKLNKTIVKK